MQLCLPDLDFENFTIGSSWLIDWLIFIDETVYAVMIRRILTGESVTTKIASQFSVFYEL